MAFHSIWASILSPVTICRTQLPANDLRNAAEDGPIAKVSAFPVNWLQPGLALANAAKSKPADGRLVSLSPTTFLSVTLIFINKFESIPE